MPSRSRHAPPDVHGAGGHPFNGDDLPDDWRRCDALLYNIDLAPTLCDMFDIPIPGGWQGTPSRPAIRGDRIDSRGHLVLGHGAHTCQRAVRTRDHLYIRTYHPGSFRAGRDVGVLAHLGIVVAIRPVRADSRHDGPRH